ncbi:LysR substrate-binding domain-containing protein [Nocardioides sp. L-11A]|uniref:LysR substrate-binding domain-containing protein n=1 Tax=Nocardioides sp. L-11A TaxID=3043848 RepID=UPI00249B9DBB|nr:LysR substrate-binding domain-containing protein [Nocardioides sp. L-11A]
MAYAKLIDGRLKLRHFVIALAVAETGSLGRAAQVLHVSQPSLTRLVHDLEAVFGTQLFDRTATGTAPTPAGEEFLRHAAAIVATLATTDKRMASYVDGSAGLVTVGAYAVGSSDLLPAAIARVKAVAPRMQIRLRDATPDILIPALQSGEVDLAIGRIESYLGRSAGLTTEVLHREPIVVVAAAGDPALRHEAPDLAQLRDAPWVLPLPQTALRHDIDDAFRRRGVELPENLLECNQPSLVRDLVVACGALGVVARSVAELMPDVEPLGRDLLGLTQQVGLAYRTEPGPTPAAAAVRSALRATAAAGAEHGPPDPG